ncbi:galactokinase [Flavobacteriaceae bacterium PRS1]|nr:galactokinase [Flavobacteriaceae bacterium PRS1]
MKDRLILSIKQKFISKFNSVPILVFSPGRINLIGEHTDYNDGFVFPAAIDKGIVAAIHYSDEHFSSVIAYDVNEQLDFSLEHIQSLKKGGWKNYVLGVVAEIRKKDKHLGNFKLVFGGNIPIGAGLSSSAALENSIVYSLNELFQLGLTKKEMIAISQKAEHNYVGVKCGIMDQYASMFGVKNSALLLDCRHIKATNFKIDFKDYDILLINTNVKHSLAESVYNERRATCEKIVSLLNIKSLRDASEIDLLSIKDQIPEEDYQKVLYVIQENQRVFEASKAVQNNDIKLLGKLFYDSHHGLQHQYQVSCDELDFLVEATKDNDTIIGARMMGSGFGGCTINLIKKGDILDFSNFIKEAFKNKFKTDCNIYNVNLSQGTYLIKS